MDRERLGALLAAIDDCLALAEDAERPWELRYGRLFSHALLGRVRLLAEPLGEDVYWTWEASATCREEVQAAARSLYRLRKKVNELLGRLPPRQHGLFAPGPYEKGF